MKIAVYGAASNKIDSIYLETVEVLGKEMAKRGHSLVFGGGASGLMGAAARGVYAEKGEILGIAPTFFAKVDGVLFKECTETIYTESMRERKYLLEEHADAFVITPGGVGTFEEFFEAFTLKQLGQFDKPIVVYNINGYYNTLLKMLEEAIENDFMSPSNRDLFVVLEDMDEIFHYLDTYHNVKDQNYRNL